MTGAPATPPSGRRSPGPWTLLAVLTVLNVLNFVDRSLVASLAPLLIADLGLSRTQIGWLAGYGFVLFYTVVGLLLGPASDRYRRMPIVAGGVALWSAMTALSGFARGFVQLALPRVFVGVGEATLTPAALSMLGDAFPAARLATATGVYYAGIPLGSGLAMIAASWLAPQFGWRACFWILGGAGVVAALALPLLGEPARRAAAGGAPAGRRFGEAFAALRARPELALTLAGGCLLCYGSASAIHVVTWLVEARGLPYARAAFAAGVVGVVAGFAGNVAGGALGDAFARRGAHGPLRSLVPLALAFAGTGALFYLAPAGTPLFYLGWFLAAGCTSAWFGPLFAAVQELAPAHARATTVALALVALNLLAVGPGALVTGAIGDARGLTTGLLVSLGVVLLATLPLTLAARRLAHPGR